MTRAALVLAVVVLTAAAIAYPVISGAPAVNSDGEGYYAWVRLYLVRHGTDFATLPLPHPHIVYGFRVAPGTGRLAGFYPIGTALAQLPFVLGAHLVASVIGGVRDGYGPAYQWALRLAALAWLLGGLEATRRVVAARTTARGAVVALAALILGTNLLHYAIVEPSMSHVYAFGALALTLWLGDRFWRDPTHRRAAVLGAAVGLLVSIRHYDAVFVPLVLYPALTARADVVRRHAATFGLAALVALLPHLATTTYYLGAPWANTYWGIPLSWTSPRIASVLFSVEKGWWFWTPTAAVGVVGLAWGARSSMFCRLGLAGIAAVVYVVAAWPAWSMGESFGHRAFVDALPVVAVGLARVAAVTLATLPALAALNVFLMWAYAAGHVTGAGMTWAAYARAMRTPLEALSGRAPADSRSREGLTADISVVRVERRPHGLALTVVARNAGTARWLSGGGRGSVSLAVRLFERDDCGGASAWQWRFPIARDVGPAEAATVVAFLEFAFWEGAGRYACLDMLAEHVAFFGDVGPPRRRVTIDLVATRRDL